MAQKSDYIAVFDSGVGGISVLRQLLKVLPNEKYLYFGDSIHAPYGVRPEEEVRQLTIAAAEKLRSCCAPRRRKKACRISHAADPAVCAPGVAVL